MSQPKFRIGHSAKPEQTHFVREILESAGWVETQQKDWQLCWQHGAPSSATFRSLQPGQRLNHFRGIGHLNDKSRLHANLVAARDRLAHIGADGWYDFFPRSFSMPEDFKALQSASRASPETIWIQKPKRLSRGRGVTLVSDVSQVERHRRWLVQEYLSAPHLLDDHKYTLRFYLLVTSLDPLLAYLYHDGLVRFASRPYHTDQADWSNPFIHLTNAAVATQDPDGDVSAKNLTHTQYRRRLQAQGIDDIQLWGQIRRIIIATLIAVREPMLQMSQSNSALLQGCFELLGIDILIDHTLKPWLIECNLGPSLTLESTPTSPHAQAESALKRQLVEDVLTLTGAVGDPVDTRAAFKAQTDKSRLEDSAVLEAAAREFNRRGGFERLLPTADVAQLLPLFPVLRHADLLLARSLCSTVDSDLPKLEPYGVYQFFLEDGLVLFSEPAGRLYVLNPTATFIWLHCVDGLSPRAIAAQLSRFFSVPLPSSLCDVDTVRTEWMAAGLLRQTGHTVASHSPATSTPSVRRRRRGRRLKRLHERHYSILGWNFRVCYPSDEVARWLHPILAPFESPILGDRGALFEIYVDAGQYTLCRADGVNFTCSGAKQLAPLLVTQVWQSAYRAVGCLATLYATILGESGRYCVLPGQVDTQKAKLLAILEERGVKPISYEAMLRRSPLEFVPSSTAWDANAIPVHSLVFIRDKGDEADQQEALIQISRAEALSRLITSSFHIVPPLQVHNASNLVDWMRTMDCYEISLAHIPQAAALIQQQLRDTSGLP